MSERLQKYLARAGVASRRAAEGLITAGRVRINNERVTVLGTKVEPGDLVTLDGKLVTPAEERAYYILYKPTGVVTTMEDPQGRATVASLLEGVGRRLFPVGRLDYDAEGALLCTDDGELAHQLTHPSFEVPRTYLAKVKGVPDQASLDKLRGGVRLEDGMAKPEEVEVHEAAEKNTWLRLVVTEGRPHLIKRLCAAIGHPVVRLYRPSQGGIRVKGMAPGALRPLTEKEVELLWRVARGERVAEGELTLPPRRHGRSGGEDDDASLDLEDEAPAPPSARAKAGGGARQGAERASGPRSGAAARKPGRGGTAQAAGASSGSRGRGARAGDAGGERGRAPAGEGRGRAFEGRATGRAPSRNFTAERGAVARGGAAAARGVEERGGGRSAAGRSRPEAQGAPKGRTFGSRGGSLAGRSTGATGRSTGATGRSTGATGRSTGTTGRSTGTTGRSTGTTGRSTGATGRSTGATGRSTGATGRSTGGRGAPAARRTGPSTAGKAGKGPSAGDRGRSAGAGRARPGAPSGPRGKRPGSGAGRPGGKGRSR